MRLEELKGAKFYCTFAECHKQNWKDGSSWTGYENTPRAYHAFVLVCSDMKAEFRCDGNKTIVARKGDVIYVPKNARYTVSFFHTSNRLDSYAVNFLLRDERGREIVFDDEMGRLGNRWDGACLSTVEAFYKTYVNADDRIKTQARFYDFLAAVCDLTNGKIRYYYPIKKGVDLLVEQWKENQKIDDYAKLCGVDKSYFYKLFKAWSGKSPNRYRNDLRISVAKSKLKSSNLSVLEIAEETGFDDPYYFSRLFKKTVGVSPSQYRKLDLRQD